MSLPYTEKRRPTISLAMIVKNEVKNLPRLFASINGCFDEIHITDTGSTDGTIEWLKENGENYSLAKTFVHNFNWINDFAAARNYSFSHVKTDYVLWLDGDDALSNREAFIQWRDYAMEFADVWFATYNYALDANGAPIIKFIRERVFKVSKDVMWQYPIHEGIVVPTHLSKDIVPNTSWSINHLRDSDDILADKSRNITILERLRDENKLDARLKFYYGKELYESGKTFDSIAVFDSAIAEKGLEQHDRALSYQYAAYAAIQCGDNIKPEMIAERYEFYGKALNYCFEGIKFDPTRAEFHVIIGDIYLKKQDLAKAIPFYAAAKACRFTKPENTAFEGAIYSFVDCYGLNPSLQLTKILTHIGRIEDAKKEIQECIDLYDSKEAKDILLEIEKIQGLVNLDNNQQETEDIVFTCPVTSAYEFDEELYKVKGMGGSETALIEVAKHLKEMTGRPVKVFAMREKDLVCESGVEYLSNRGLNEYFSKYRPKVHIAWRHNIKITHAPTYLWCHDLVTPSVEVSHHFDKILCLTEFHKNYVMAKQSVPADKIIVTRNGLSPEKFAFERKPKNPNKLVWMSSPDRGLVNCIPMLDIVKKTHPDIELHIFYGFDNLYKFGLGALADKLQEMIKERPWIKYHGFMEQSKMYQEMSDAAVWTHCANFIETFAITAIEQLALGVYPVTRRLGALQDTLREAEMHNYATLLNHDCVTTEEREAYASEVCRVLDNKLWENITFDIEKHSWATVAREWMKFMGL